TRGHQRPAAMTIAWATPSESQRTCWLRRGSPPCSPGKTRGHAPIVRVQREPPPVALAQSLDDAETEAISTGGSGAGRRKRVDIVTAQAVGDQQLVLLDEDRDRSLAAGRLLERIPHQVGDRDQEGLWMPANDCRREAFDLDVDAFAVQQVALLVDRPAHQRCDQ